MVTIQLPAGVGEASLGHYADVIKQAVSEMATQRIVWRIWQHDHTVWKPEPTEVADRLGWLDSPTVMIQDEHQQRLADLMAQARGAGYTHALLLGMGGSSLAPEMFRKVFGVQPGYLDLVVLDTTDPSAVLAYAHRLDLTKTLCIVSTKSGGTVETLSLFKYFYNRMAALVGVERVGEHFVAITDPGSSLVNLAERYNFRAVLLNDPNIGGRYSALSYFGLSAAMLVGADVGRLLKNAQGMAAACGAEVAERDHPGVWLGAILGELARQGRDKATLVLSPAIASFGDWVEQLLAESTGKEGKGILPVVGERLGMPDSYSQDRLFVHLSLTPDPQERAALDRLAGAGHPVVRLTLSDVYDLGGQCFLWEFATAVAGQRLGIQPFDQPNVEAAKVLARAMVEEYRQQGHLPRVAPVVTEDGLAVYGDLQATSLREALAIFLARAQLGGYIALQAYLRPQPAVDEELAHLRVTLREKTRLATTVGYGPRFLHSTGQLHKGDAGRGLFIQLTADDAEDVPIPDEAGKEASSITFGILKMAQALGDAQALRQGGRSVMRIHLAKNDVVDGLRRLRLALT